MNKINIVMYKIVTTMITIALLTFSSFAQKPVGKVEMADVMRSSGKIYVVVAVLLVIFAGTAAYLFFMDRKLSKLEKEINAKKAPDAHKEV